MKARRLLIRTRSSIYKSENWFFANYDGRRSDFKGISRSEFAAAKDRHFSRQWRASREIDIIAKAAWRREMIAYFSEIPYEYSGDGMDDFSKYQRPSRTGNGYVAVCPGEPGNNVYVDDEMLVKYLKSKYYSNRYDI